MEGDINTLAIGFNLPIGITKDQNGNFYVVNGSDSTVAKLTAQ